MTIFCVDLALNWIISEAARLIFDQEFSNTPLLDNQSLAANAPVHFPVKLSVKFSANFPVKLFVNFPVKFPFNFLANLWPIFWPISWPIFRQTFLPHVGPMAMAGQP